MPSTIRIAGTWTWPQTMPSAPRRRANAVARRSKSPSAAMAPLACPRTYVASDAYGRPSARRTSRHAVGIRTARRTPRNPCAIGTSHRCFVTTGSNASPWTTSSRRPSAVSCITSRATSTPPKAWPA